MSDVKSNRTWLVLPLVIFVILSVVFLYRLATHKGDAIPSALIGKSVPQFVMPPVPELMRDGKQVPGLASEDLKGQVTLVNIFASWCAPCREEHPLLVELAKDTRFRVVGLNYKDQPENARRFLGVLGNPYLAVGSDLAGRTAIDWGVYGVPETFIVSNTGMILYKHVGPLTEEAIKGPIEAVIAKAVAE